MVSGLKIRMVKTSDAKAMLDIYGPIVLNTATSFETEVPTLSEFEQRIISYSFKAPWLVAELNGQITGYAYATDHRSRKAYQWNQEVTAYVHEDFRKKGIARNLYLRLFEMLKAMNFQKAIAVITLPNNPSLALHQSLGFQPIGEMKNIGFKNGNWYSTSWWDLGLQEPNQEPQPLRPLKELTQ